MSRIRSIHPDQWRDIVARHLAIGVHARRVPLSGAVDGFKGDVHLWIADQPMVAEIKARASGDGFKTLERWLGANDVPFLARDRSEPLVVVPWATWAKPVGAGQRMDNYGFNITEIKA